MRAMVRSAFSPDEVATASAAKILKHDLAPDAEDWAAWCAWCSSNPEIGSWIQADLEDAIRFVDDGYFEDGRWVPGDLGDARRRLRGLRFVYETLRHKRISVSQRWAYEPDTLTPTPAAPLDPDTWQEIQKPREIVHWLDVRDNALIYLASVLALRAGEIANLRPQHLRFDSRDWLLEVRSRAECRWMRVRRAGACLWEWKDLHGRFMDQRYRQLPSALKLFELHLGGELSLNARTIELFVEGIVRKARVRAGLQPLPFSYASLCLSRAHDLQAEGMTIEEAAYFFGWNRALAQDVWRLRARFDPRMIIFAN